MIVSNLAHRAGRYVRQPSGYRAFLPAALPPDPPLHLEGELQSLLSRANRALGRLDGSVQTLAGHVGPFAKHLVTHHARKTHQLNDFYDQLASSIPNTEERRRFLNEINR